MPPRSPPASWWEARWVFWAFPPWSACIDRAGPMLSVGWLPPSLGPSGAGLARGPRVSCHLRTLTRGAPHRGCASSNSTWLPLKRELRDAWGLWGHRHLVRHSPQKGTQFSGDGHDHPMGVCAACEQWSRAFAEPHLGFPTHILDGFGHLCQPPWEVTTALCWRPGGPGACDQGAARLGGAGLLWQTLRTSGRGNSSAGWACQNV
jgi:hypothetical protein